MKSQLLLATGITVAFSCAPWGWSNSLESYGPESALLEFRPDSGEYSRNDSNAIVAAMGSERTSMPCGPLHALVATPLRFGG